MSSRVGWSATWSPQRRTTASASSGVWAVRRGSPAPAARPEKRSRKVRPISAMSGGGIELNDAKPPPGGHLAPHPRPGFQARGGTDGPPPGHGDKGGGRPADPPP